MKDINEILPDLPEIKGIPYPHLLTGALDEFLNDKRPLMLGQLYLFVGIGTEHRQFMADTLAYVLEPMSASGVLTVSTTLYNDRPVRQPDEHVYAPHPRNHTEIRDLFESQIINGLRLVVVADLDGISVPSEYLRLLRCAAQCYQIMVVVGSMVSEDMLPLANIKALSSADKARICAWGIERQGERLVREVDRSYFVEKGNGPTQWTFYEGKFRNVIGNDAHTHWVSVNISQAKQA